MPIALWNDQFKTGIEVIDTQHRALFDGLNQFAEAVQDGSARQDLDERLATLAQHTIKHFQTEETLMKEMGYPSRTQHSDQHHTLILQVRSLQYRQAKGQPLGREVVAFLADWFDHHIKDADLDYARYMRA